MSTNAKRAQSEYIVPDALILAAIERANLHEGRALRSHVAKHLGYRHAPATTRWLRPRIEAMEEVGQVEQHRSLGLTYWRLTDAGAKRLEAERRVGKVGALPESPQHREWRAAQQVACERIEEVRAAAHEVAEEAARLLSDGGTPDPGVVEKLRRDLERHLKCLHTASYCLRAWPEPDEGIRDPNRAFAWRDLRGSYPGRETNGSANDDGREGS